MPFQREIIVIAVEITDYELEFRGCCKTVVLCFICISSSVVMNHLQLVFLSLKWSRGCSFSSSTVYLTKKSGST